jgi:4-alpha-glucanotransferase
VPCPSRYRSRLGVFAEALRGDSRAFGIAAQLYRLRRELVDGMGDQGIGDFTTLRLLAEKAAAVGAATVELNPLHALFSSDPDRSSPYHPSDRRFLDPLAIDAFNLPAPLLTARVRAAIAQAVPEASRLSAKPLVDYAAAAALKNPLFDAAHAAFRDPARNRPRDPLVEDHAAFVREGGETLRRFAMAFAAAHADAIPKTRFCNGSRTGSLPPPPALAG